MKQATPGNTSRPCSKRAAGIPGVGATRRRALLTHFKSVANIAAATPEALCEVEGIGKAQAKAIWNYYHPEEKESGGAKP